MDEQRYLGLAQQAFDRIRSALDRVDPDLAEAELAADVLTITFADRRRCIVNTQRPVHQMWVAHGTQAWHLSYDEATSRWLDDKGRGDELYSLIARITKEQTGLDVTI